MKSAFAFGLAVLGLAACEPQKPAQVATPNVALPGPAASAPAMTGNTSCGASATGKWIAGATYAVQAVTLGTTCEKSVVVLTIRDPQDTPLFTWTGRATDLFLLDEAKNGPSMAKALADWIDQKNSSLTTTDQLPAWEKTAGQPKAEEFPFHTEAGYDKAAWDDMRKQKLNLFCFPQGKESLDCLMLRDGQIEEIGLQQFPG